MHKTINDLRNEVKAASRFGAPIITAGSIYFLALFGLSFFLDQKILELIWVVGIGVIFPLGILIGRLQGANLFVKNNQLAMLAGIVGGIQALFIPAYIVVYKFMPEWLPFFIGTLTAAHFIPYIWIYQTKIYTFMTLGMAAVSIVFGSMHAIAYVAVPLGIAITYGVSAIVMNVAARRRTMKTS